LVRVQVGGPCTQYLAERRPKLIDLAMRLSGGALATERQAEFALLGFAVVIIAISVFFFTRGGEPPVDYSKVYGGIDQSQFAEPQ
jgi:hypothetical protein